MEQDTPAPTPWGDDAAEVEVARIAARCFVREDWTFRRKQAPDEVDLAKLLTKMAREALADLAEAIEAGYGRPVEVRTIRGSLFATARLEEREEWPEVRLGLELGIRWPGEG